MDLTTLDRRDPRAARAGPRCARGGSGRRPHALGGRRRAGARRGRGARAARRRRLRPRRPHRHGRRGHAGRASWRRCSARRRRSARSIRVPTTRPSAVSSRSGSRATAGSGTGPLRDRVLEVRFVTADGRLVKGGGPTVKNVSGFDIPRLLVGSFGTIGVLVQVILRCQPVPEVVEWSATDDDPFDVRRRTYRPSCIAWDGEHDASADRRRRRRRRARAAGRGRRARGRRAAVARRTSSRPHLDRARRASASSRPRWPTPACGGSPRSASAPSTWRPTARPRSRPPAPPPSRTADGCCGRRAHPASTASGVPLPNLAIMQRIRAAFDPEGKLNAGRFAFGPRAPVEVDGQVDGETAYV